MAYHSPLCIQRYLCRHAILLVTYQALENSMHAKVVCDSMYREYRIRQMNTTLLTQQKQTSNQYMILTLNYQTIVICNTITSPSTGKREAAQRAKSNGGELQIWQPWNTKYT